MAFKRDKEGVLMLTGSKWDYAIYIVLSLAVSYGFASFAIDSGSLWDYAGAIVFLILAIRFVRQGLRRFFNH